MLKSKAVWLGFYSLSSIIGLKAQDCHLALRGQVTELEQNEPLAFASVFVKELGKSTITDENGWFMIPNLCEKTAYTIEVRHIECAHFTQIVELTENAQVDFHLTHSAILNEVVVKEKALPPPKAQAESVVNQIDLESSKGVSLAETLKRLPGVSSLNTGSTIAKPVIQGLHSNRIAIVTNGVTLEGQQWGSEHAPEIDPFTAGKVSVIKGAAGLRYGVGAMGGAVILEPAPLREADGLGGWFNVGTFSNGLGAVLSGTADWRLPGKSLAIRVQGTGKRSGNLRTPDYFLGNTGASELNFSTMAGWQNGHWEHELSASRFAQKIGILRAAHISDTATLREAIRSDVPLQNDDRFTWDILRPYQDIQHNMLKYKTLFRFSEKWKMTGQYTWQYNNRREFDAHPPKSDPQDLSKKPQQSFRIWTNTLDLALEHLPISHWQGGMGIQGIHQLNYIGKGGSLPDYQMFGGSVWGMERWRRFPVPWEFEAGIRYDFRRAIVTTEGNGNMDLDTALVYHNVSGSLGGIFHVGNNLSITLHTGLAWRPPHVNELFARGVHHGAATYERGDASLLPEKSWNSNLSIQYRKGRKAASLTVYRNQIRDFIYIQSLDSIIVTVRGPFPFYQYAQAQSVVIQGIDADLVVPVFKDLAFEGRVSLLRGWKESDFETSRDWLPLMPVDKIQYGLQWAKTKGTASPEPGNYLKLLASTSLRQTRIPIEGLLKDAPAGFTTLNLEAGYHFDLSYSKRKFPLHIGLSVQNLSNLRYREYLNFFRYFTDETGINFALRAKLTFGK
ncbi:MAG: TonB-dependent receptor [Saprospiraceae bacterium]